MEEPILKYLHFDCPTAEQVTALRAMAEFVKKDDQHDFLILCGSAGTGKTSLTAALIGLLNQDEQPYRIAAPTGRAARILGRKANTTTSTIHSLIYTPNSDIDSGKITFKLKIGYNKSPIVYIIDEASMINKDVNQTEGLFEVEKGLIFDLITFIKSGNPENKIIFLGDRYQLPPIGESKSFALDQFFLEKTFNLKGSSYQLTEVKRQEDGSYILRNATEIRNAIDQGLHSYPIDGQRSPNIYSAVNNYLSEAGTNGFEYAVSIGVSHKANKFFNDLVRERTFGKAKKILERGDLMMMSQNWHRNGVYLYNGDHIEVLDIDWELQEQVAGLHFVAVKIRLLLSDKEAIVEDLALLETIVFPGGVVDAKKENELRRQRYTKNKLFAESHLPSDDRYVGALRMIYGHAITCNKAQGGEWRKVFINTWGIPSLKWQYTAVTRGISDIETF